MIEEIVPEEVRLEELKNDLKKARQAPKEHWTRLIKASIVLTEATKSKNKASEYINRTLPNSPPTEKPKGKP